MEKNHPIIDAALLVLIEKPDGTVGFDKKKLPELEDAVAAYFDQPGLVDAVKELMTFAIYLGEAEHSRPTALELLRVASTATVAIEARALSDHEGLRQAQSRAAEVFAGKAPAKAPQYDGKKPEGSVSLSSILSALPGRKLG